MILQITTKIFFIGLFGNFVTNRSANFTSIKKLNHGTKEK